MCKIQSPPASLCLKSFAPLPRAPCIERRVSEKTGQAVMTAAVVQDLSIPFPLLPTTRRASAPVGLRLSLTPIINTSESAIEGRFRDALHRMSTSNDSRHSSSAEIKKEEQESGRPSVDAVITERMAKLMGGTREGRKSNLGSSGKLASSRSSSPVPMPRGVGRTNSGAALCA